MVSTGDGRAGPVNKIPSNFFGNLYPSYDHDKLVDIFSIGKNDKVLDIGGGHKPFSRADYIVECDLNEGIHRDGQKIPAALQGRYVEADIHDLPFEDKSFDFVFCSHVMEHVADPGKACREICRVGKRGFIETPRKWVEFFAGYPSHQWLVDHMDGQLIFERKQFLESPYLNAILPVVWRNKVLEERALKHFLNISCIQLYWENNFRVKIIDAGPDAFAYSNPLHAGLSHFYFARNLLFFDAPPEHGIFHARIAVRFCPDNEVFWALCALYALTLKDEDLWSESFNVLRKNILSNSDTILLKLGFRKALIGKLRKVVQEDGNFG